MRYREAGRATDWILYEAVINGKFLCTGELVDAGDDELQKVYSELHLLRVAGCPADLDKGSPELQKLEKCKTGERIHVLKVYGSQWRLYFYVINQKDRTIEFIHAVGKKKQKRNPADFKRCCRVIADIRAGRTKRAVIEIPRR